MARPDSRDERLELATEAAKKQRFSEAANLLESLLADAPDNLRALDLFGFVRFFQSRYEEAETCCRRALALKPDHAYAMKGLGLCLARQNRLDEGVEMLEGAIALKPKWFDPYWDLAVVLSEGQRHEEALAVLGRGQISIPERRTAFAQLAARIREQLGRRDR